MTLTDRLSGVLERKLSRRSLLVRSAFVGSAVASGGAGFVLRPGSAYATVACDSVYCGSTSCSCSDTCCAGYTEFCCVLDGGYNSCPEDTIMGGWWMAEGSAYCSGPRYYMDCNATCKCTDGCGSGFSFCDTGCDGLTCECAGGSCGNYLTGCFQFRYGQCNQDVGCIGRIQCRVVTCVPPWEIEPSCTKTSATDDTTADQTAACVTSGPTYPPPPVPPCDSVETQCKAIGIAVSDGDKGYGIVTSFGKVIGFGDLPSGTVEKDISTPVAAMATTHVGGYWLVTQPGKVLPLAGAESHGDPLAENLTHPIVDIVPTSTGKGYWLVSTIGRIFAYGDAVNKGGLSATGKTDIIGMAPSASGQGYWIATSKGEIYTYGDAVYKGNAITQHPKGSFVGIASNPAKGGNGYWLVSSGGDIYSFGDAKYYGGQGTSKLAKPIVGMAATPTGKGYFLVAADGGVFTHGDAKYRGSAA